MLTIKFARIGKKKKPTFRLIISEKSRDPFGKALEILGHYNPNSKKYVFNEDRIKYWLSKGAQATDSVHNLLVSKEIIKGKKIKPYKITKKRLAKINKKNNAKEKKVEKAENETPKE